MPIYEYACEQCDTHFDVRHGVDEKPALQCPDCAGSVRKVFHAAGVIFKGSGWHINDYATKKREVDPVETPTPKVDPPAPKAETPAPATETATTA